jgi:hypothetical protein
VDRTLITDVLKPKKTWVTFEEHPVPATWKTKAWLVLGSGNERDVIGDVRWNAHWRQYVFQPNGNTIYNPDCLEQIATFVRAQTALHISKRLLKSIPASLAHLDKIEP